MVTLGKKNNLKSSVYNRVTCLKINVEKQQRSSKKYRELGEPLSLGQSRPVSPVKENSMSRKHDYMDENERKDCDNNNYFVEVRYLKQFPFFFYTIKLSQIYIYWHAKLDDSCFLSLLLQFFLTLTGVVLYLQNYFKNTDAIWFHSSQDHDSDGTQHKVSHSGTNNFITTLFYFLHPSDATVSWLSWYFIYSLSKNICNTFFSIYVSWENKPLNAISTALTRNWKWSFYTTLTADKDQIPCSMKESLNNKTQQHTLKALSRWKHSIRKILYKDVQNVWPLILEN